jgi:imidazolonepropionase-like amidohydrolase
MHADGDALGEVRSIKRGLASGEFVGPRYLANGSLVDGYPPVHRGSIVVRTASEARAVVDSLADGGADFIKVYDSLTRESYDAIIDQARRRGIAVDGHMPFAVPSAEAARAGQRTVEHLTGMTLGCSSDIEAIRSDYLAHTERMPQMDPVTEEVAWLDIWRRASESRDAAACRVVVSAYADAGVAVVPTLIHQAQRADPQAILADPTARRLVPSRVWDQWGQMQQSGPFQAMASILAPINERSLGDLRALHAAGVPSLAGTDLGNPFVVAGRSLHDELAALVSAGLTPLEALRSATSAPARIFGLSDSLGTVTAGSIADLVLLAGNPLVDIGNVRRITGVVLRGEYFDRPRLDALVDAAVAVDRSAN